GGERDDKNAHHEQRDELLDQQVREDVDAVPLLPLRPLDTFRGNQRQETVLVGRPGGWARGATGGRGGGSDRRRGGRGVLGGARSGHGGGGRSGRPAIPAVDGR